MIITSSNKVIFNKKEISPKEMEHCTEIEIPNVEFDALLLKKLEKSLALIKNDRKVTIHFIDCKFKLVENLLNSTVQILNKLTKCEIKISNCDFSDKILSQIKIPVKQNVKVTSSAAIVIGGNDSIDNNNDQQEIMNIMRDVQMNPSSLMSDPMKLFKLCKIMAKQGRNIEEKKQLLSNILPMLPMLGVNLNLETGEYVAGGRVIGNIYS